MITEHNISVLSSHKKKSCVLKKCRQTPQYSPPPFCVPGRKTRHEYLSLYPPIGEKRLHGQTKGLAPPPLSLSPLTAWISRVPGTSIATQRQPTIATKQAVRKEYQILAKISFGAISHTQVFRILLNSVHVNCPMYIHSSCSMFIFHLLNDFKWYSSSLCSLL